MLGDITLIKGDLIILKPSFNIRKSKKLTNSFVLIKDSDNDYIGEVTDIEVDSIYIHLIGTLVNNNVVFGISRKPSINSKVYLLEDKFISTVLGSNNNGINFGISPVYNNASINVSIDSFFGSHFAIFGSSGSGKSCSFARIIQNVFTLKNPTNAKIVIFDAYGEYKSAFEGLPNTSFNSYTTNTTALDKLIKIPLWLLTVDDIALLLNATKSTQLSVIDKALRFVNIFARESEEFLKYKNSIIANSLLDILMSGRRPAQIRDQVLAILAKYNTEELNSGTKIIEPGYTRTLKQCLAISEDGNMKAIELVQNVLQGFIVDDISLELPDGTFKYTLNDLLLGLDFALIDEGVFNSEEVYDSVNFLKIRLGSLIKSDYSKYFECDYLDRDNFIKEIFKGQIINFNISYIDDRFAKTVTKIYSKLIFDYCKSLKKRGSFVFNIVLEEAHRYVQNDSDVDIIGYNIFERICKEGRKYGTLMGFISQRPSELSETCLSQCSNFLIFKMIHENDVLYVKNTVPYITDTTLEKIKTLSPGEGMAFGKSFKIPTLIKFNMPEPSTDSDNPNVSNIWFNKDLNES